MKKFTTFILTILTILLIVSPVAASSTDDAVTTNFMNRAGDTMISVMQVETSYGDTMVDTFFTKAFIAKNFDLPGTFSITEVTDDVLVNGKLPKYATAMRMYTFGFDSLDVMMVAVSTDDYAYLMAIAATHTLTEDDGAFFGEYLLDTLATDRVTAPDGYSKQVG